MTRVLLLAVFFVTAASAQSPIFDEPRPFDEPGLPHVHYSETCPEPGDLRNNTCLQDDRFEVEMHWTRGRTNNFKVSEQTLLAYFRDPENLEIMVKVLDGCYINGYYWVFFAAVTDQSFEVDVRDYSNRTRKVWKHRGGAPTTVNDTRAFPCEG